MSIENSPNSHYASNSGNSYTYITNNFDHSFNTSRSHNGHGRASGCGLPLLIALVPLSFVVFGCYLLSGVLT